MWSDTAVDWRTFELVVIRSCWDYHLRSREFLSWIHRLEREGVALLNPPSVVRWNMHKSYLLDLESRGVRIPATQIITARERVVVKPAISASAHSTHVMQGDVIVQAFVPEVTARGEWSIVFFDRVFSHSVIKKPKEGDFRVQEELGGSADAADAPRDVISAAAMILDCIDDELLYARVDMVERREGVTLMELELIEPWLFLTKHPQGTQRFVDAIRRRL